MSLPWTSEQAIIWLEGQSRHPDKDYTNLCAHLVSRAFGYNGAGFPSASAWARSVPKSKRHYGKAPRGAVQFWETNGWGHVAVADGTDHVVCNNASGGVSRIAVSYYRGLGTPFWVTPGPWLFTSAFGVNPNSDAPKVPANPIVARPGKRSSKVPALRKALGGKSTSTYYGAVLNRRVRKWKRQHHVTPVNGIVRAHLYDRITK